ncbi:fatty acyl-AMP ligase [Prauserella endophytica]|uniref:Fatty acyl-AMP ligase n=1 Tax=Prauserella endophytica TaxID=1592324 RepID=A0ABY2RU25_9PSEU|nr:fatty acyl-AMP ligase [Prauserella endophytica]
MSILWGGNSPSCSVNALSVFLRALQRWLRRTSVSVQGTRRVPLLRSDVDVGGGAVTGEREMIEESDHFMSRFRSWVDFVPDEPAIVFVDEFGEVNTKDIRGDGLTYRELDERARSLAAGLVGRGLRGARVLLSHPPGLEFTVALLGCFHAGVIAVPAPVPESGGRGDTRLTGIVTDAEVGVVLTTPATAGTVRGWLGRAGLAERVEVLVEADLREGRHEPLPELDPEAIAFLQYTSGSTSEPKGVLVTHRALASNASESRRALGVGWGVRSVSWLPHYHDMGLVGQLLGPMYCGGTAYLMAPMSFLKRPHRWMRLITAVKAHVTVAPDFGYALVTRRTTDEQLAELDLSSLDVVMNGSEPIHAATLDKFAARFAPAGLRAASIMPCYGMAETTLFVTAAPRGTGYVARDVDAAALASNRIAVAEDGRPSRRLVSSGRPVDFDIRIVDPETRAELPPGSVGEIWLAGPSVAAGYWARPDVSQDTFRARLSGSDADYLRTGDLGGLFDGELFVTGRRKEVLIVNGRNLYPQDIERTIREAHPVTGAGATAVFTVEAQAPAAVAVQEVRPADLRTVDVDELVAVLRRAVRAEFELHLADVVFVPTGAIEKTTSGKVRRGATRDAFLVDGLRTLHTTVAGR